MAKLGSADGGVPEKDQSDGLDEDTRTTWRVKLNVPHREPETLTRIIKGDLGEVLKPQFSEGTMTADVSSEHVKRDFVEEDLTPEELEAYKVSDQLYYSYLRQLLAGEVLDVQLVRQVLDNPSTVSELVTRLMSDVKPIRMAHSGMKASRRLHKFMVDLRGGNPVDVVHLRENMGPLVDILTETAGKYAKGNAEFDAVYNVLAHVLERLTDMTELCDPTLDVEVEQVLLEAEDQEKAREKALAVARKSSVVALEDLDGAISDYTISVLEVAEALEQQKAAAQERQLVGVGNGN